MQTYCITFPMYHPLRIEMEAAHENETARFLFGRRFGFIYLKTVFESGYYPGGRVGLVIKASWINNL